jgi:uncharacterized protein (DUF305 family)
VAALRAATALACLLAAAALGCGDDDGSNPLSLDRVDPNATDAAFVRAMVPHQQKGVAIAEIAQRRAKRAELRQIGREIADEQEPTIPRLRALDPKLPAPSRRSGAGIGGDPAPIDPNRLRDPVSFDREFLGMMIRHHEDTLAMAEEELDRGGDGRLKRLAREIYDSQKRELEKLRRWLRTWYGIEGPEGPGGTPPPSGASPET